MQEPLVHARLLEGAVTEVDQPGLSAVREATVNCPRRFPGRATFRRDLLAGLNSALSSVPDGMVCGLLAGVNPIHGLYACMAGPIAGGLLTSTQLMMITTTAAAALGAGQALYDVPFEERAGALVLLVVMVGLFQVMFGALKMGRLTRFVSFSVMTGFVSGIAVRAILTQLDTLTGLQSTGANVVTRAFDLFTNITRADLATVCMAALTAGLVVVLTRTRLGRSGTIIAIAIPSLIVWLIGLHSVRTIQDIGEIPRGIPMLAIPRLSYFSTELVSSAFAIAIVILVQGAGVSQSAPNPDDSEREPSRDFIAQGVGNLASGLLQGLPIGGSLSTTALSIASGAASRWAAIMSGVLMAAIVVIFPALTERVVMPALATLLIYASAKAIRYDSIRAVRVAGLPSITAAVVTFLATLMLPIQVAVGIGIMLSAVIYVYVSSANVHLVELIEREDGDVMEVPLDRKLRSNRVTVLDAYGSLFYAGARTLERQLPPPEGSDAAVVILRLRGRISLGATLVAVLASYADKLSARGGRLYLSGLSPGALRELADWQKLELQGPVYAFGVTPIIGESTRAARADAEAWLLRVS